MAYVYKHIRLDTNTPFYIGIGSDDGSKYTRAYCKASRNRYWHNIVNKCGYSVEIILEGITWEESLIKEVEYIALYGRKEKGGILINLTDGGEGNVGYITSDESKAKQRLKRLGKPPANKGKPTPDHVKKALSKANKGRPSWNKGKSNSPETVKKWRVTMEEKGFRTGVDHHNYNKPMLPHVKMALSEANKNREPWNKGIPITLKQKEKLRAANKGRSPWNKGIPMSDEARIKLSASLKGKPSKNKGRKMSQEQIDAMVKSIEFRRIVVQQYDFHNNLLNEYPSSKEAAILNNLKRGSISLCCRGIFGSKKSNKHAGYIWKYKSESLKNV